MGSSVSGVDDIDKIREIEENLVKVKSFRTRFPIFEASIAFT